MGVLVFDCQCPLLGCQCTSGVWNGPLTVIPLLLLSVTDEMTCLCVSGYVKVVNLAGKLKSSKRQQSELHFDCIVQSLGQFVFRCATLRLPILCVLILSRLYSLFTSVLKNKNWSWASFSMCIFTVFILCWRNVFCSDKMSWLGVKKPSYLLTVPHTAGQTVTFHPEQWAHCTVSRSFPPPPPPHNLCLPQTAGQGVTLHSDRVAVSSLSSI